jgi:hypothetical protein
MSVEPFGTVFGVQFIAVFQSPLFGLRFQVALPPWASKAIARIRLRGIRSMVFIGCFFGVAI